MNIVGLLFNNRFILILIAIWFYANANCSGQFLGLYWENDGTWAKPTSPEDRHYTNGARIDIAWESKNDGLRDFGLQLTGRDEADDDYRCNMGLFVLQHMQTPDHIAKPGLRNDPDMRYATLLYGGPFIQFADEKVFDQFELGLGVLGPSAGGKFAQNLIHDLRTLPKAVDWDTQMEDRFAFDANWIKKVRFSDEKNPNLDFIGESFVALGSVHRHGGMGITARYGSKLPKDFGPAKINSPQLYHSDKNTNYIFGFIRLAGSYVEYNQFLANLEKKDYLGEMQVGFTFAFRKMELTYSQVFMSKQYELQQENDSYGTFLLAFRF